MKSYTEVMVKCVESRAILMENGTGSAGSQEVLFRTLACSRFSKLSFPVKDKEYEITGKGKDKDNGNKVEFLMKCTYSAEISEFHGYVANDPSHKSLFNK